jgi:predicted nucleic acid-binding protein
MTARWYFVDTWYLIASIDRDDAHYANARRLRLHVGRSPLVTHDAVLTEVLSFFSEEGPQLRNSAAAAVRSAFLTLEVVESSGGLFRNALDLYERRPDKAYSLVDCMSMELLRARGITHVLTNDHHFRQEGFTVLSDAP